MAEQQGGAPQQDEAAAKPNIIPGVKHVVAISSGKGGVGKSTVSVNLAVALALTGAKVGLLDADIYGPNIPMMMGVEKTPEQKDGKIAPAESHGVKLISMGFFVPEDTAVVWRGPMVHTAIQQLFRDVLWGELDYLLIDLPPGTGDAPLTLVQQVPVTGGVIVTSPQDVALLDVGRGIAMFAQVQTPVLGIVENMAGYTCPSCGTHDAIFGEGGGARLAAAFDLPLLGRIPLVPAVRVAGDAGKPIVLADPHGTVAEAFHLLARRVLDAAAGVATAAPLGVAPA